MTSPRLAQLTDAWQRVSSTSAAEEADPLVLDCAGRLAADPGGDQAHVWVSGLVMMSEYLSWRPGPTAERAALEALYAAVGALGSRSCSHSDHPYQAEMDALEDEVWNAGTGLPALGLAGQDRIPDSDKERLLCPGNVAGWARLAADVISPFTVRRIPVGAPRYHQSCISTLSGIVNDYPYVDPQQALIDESVLTAARPTRGTLAGFLVTMNATCWYATSERITDRAVLDAMIKGIEAAVPLLGDAPCTHAPGEHPDTSDPDYTNQVGYLLRSPGGRAEISEYYGWDEEDEDEDEEGEEEPLDAWVCPAFLHDLAEETLGTLRGGLASFTAEGGEQDADTGPCS
ncbi:hypothetical protein [Streptomyces sp. NPDC008001]|uniref:hypothetical protein n=1 Tax=Streptomyces sp. NPDC008001 TaxID=3364804 RepID=UPI0036EDBBB1